MDYCRNCGEPLQGRFCRMCGTAVGLEPEAMAPAAQPGYGGGYEAAQAVAPVADPAQAYAAASSGYGAQAAAGYGQEVHAGYGAPAQADYGLETQQGYGMQPADYGQQSQGGYGPEPTQTFTATPSEFDGLFRTEDGSPGLHGQTQLLPPVVEADYRMQPPGAAQQPPGGPGGPLDPDHEEPRSNRPMILATVGAVVVAAGVIIGLLYLGGQSTSSGPAGSSTVAAGPSGATSQGGGQIQVPTDGATLGPTTAASTTAAGGFHGDSLPLGPGSSGSEVKWVQERLKGLGYFNGSASGDFTQATALAVQQFQASAGVTGDAASTVGQHTIVALEAAGSTPNLRVGNRNSSVARLNAALTYATGVRLSGSRYTASTAEAVAAYQQATGLPPTGQMNAATWAKLQEGTLATG